MYVIVFELLYPIFILIISIYDYGLHVKIRLIILYHYNAFTKSCIYRQRVLLRMGEFVARNT